MEHSFDIDVAKEIGVNGAILLKNLYFWVEKNRANNKHYYEDKYWTYNSVKAFNDLFPYLTEKQLRSTLTKLEEDGYIITGNYNKSAYDRTKWYAITEKGASLLLKGQMEIPKRANENVQKGEPIPDINTNNKPDTKESAEQSSTIPYPEIINYLNTKAGTNFKSSSNDSKKFISARWKEGYRLEDFFRVIDAKVAEWKDVEKMAPYLRPKTLFSTNFESYLQQAQKSPAKKKNYGITDELASKEDQVKDKDGCAVVF